MTEFRRVLFRSAVMAPLPPVRPAPRQQQAPAQPPSTQMQPRVGSWATPTEVDAVAIPVSEGRAPGPPAESEKERLRREMNAYRMAFWERRFVACVRWLYSRARMAVYITAIVVLPGLLFPPIKGYLNWVMVANLALVGFVVVSLVAGEVTSRKPQNAKAEAENIKKDKIFQAKEKFLELKAEHEKTISAKDKKMTKAEKRIRDRKSQVKK